MFRGGGDERAANSLVEIGPWTRKDCANLKWLSIADLGGCGRFFAVFGGIRFWAAPLRAVTTSVVGDLFQKRSGQPPGRTTAHLERKPG